MSDELLGRIQGEGSESKDPNRCRLVCGDRVFEANKNTLIKNSQYFQAMFNSKCKESLTNCIELHNVNPKILELILKYIEFEAIPQVYGNKDDLLALLAASDMLFMTELFETCCAQLPSILKKGNFSEIFSLTKTYHNDNFRKELIMHLALHFTEFKDMAGDFFSVDDVRLFLTNLEVIPYDSVPSSDVLHFVVQWIKQDLNERQEYLLDLLSLIKMCSLTDESLEYFVSDEVLFEQNEVSRNYLLEKASVDQINILFHKHKRLKIYNVASDMWIDAKIVPDHRPILNAFHYGNHFYFVTFELNESSCSIFILSFSGEDDLQLLYDVGKIKGKFHICAIDSAIYIINCQLQDIRSGSFKTVVRYYNVLTHEKRIVGEKILSREVTDIASSHTHIYMLSTHRTPFLFIVSFNVALFTWFELSNPPSMQELYMEHATCCQDKLYIIRFYKVKERIQWDPDGPLSREEFCKVHEGKECLSNNDGSNTVSHEVSVNRITIYSYNQDTNNWKQKNVEQRWSYSEGFIHFHNRFLKSIPYVYLLLINRTILQINPEKCEFQEITTVPDDFYSSLHFPAYYTVFCK